MLFQKWTKFAVHQRNFNFSQVAFDHKSFSFNGLASFFMTGSDFKHVSSILNKEETFLLFKGGVKEIYQEKKVNYLTMIPFLAEVSISSHKISFSILYLITFLLT